MMDDVADSQSLPALLRGFVRSYIRDNLDDMLPATVESYDDSTNRVTIRPLVMLGTSDGQKVSRATIPNIPVLRIGGGGFFMRLPIKRGDFGWVKANDRDISLILQRNGGEDWPNTERLHSFADGVFIPDTVKDWSIDGAHQDAMVLQSLDGATVIALQDGKVTIKGASLELDGDVTITGSLSIAGSSVEHGGVSIGNDHWHGYIDSKGQAATPTPSQTKPPQTPEPPGP